MLLSDSVVIVFFVSRVCDACHLDFTSSVFGPTEARGAKFGRSGSRL